MFVVFERYMQSALARLAICLFRTFTNISNYRTFNALNLRARAFLKFETLRIESTVMRGTKEHMKIFGLEIFKNRIFYNVLLGD